MKAARFSASCSAPVASLTQRSSRSGTFSMPRSETSFGATDIEPPQVGGMWRHEWLPPEVHLRDTPHSTRGGEPVRTRLAGYVMGEGVGAGAPFLGFRWSEAPSHGPRSAVGMRWLVPILHEHASSASPPPGILGTHPREHSELTPNAGRPTPGRTLASPSPPGRLPGGPGAARDRSSDLVMPRLPVSTRSTGQGICLARSRRVACRTSLRTDSSSTIIDPSFSGLAPWDMEKFRAFPGISTTAAWVIPASRVGRGSERGEDSRYQGLRGELG